MSEKGRNDKMPKTDVYVTDQGISTELMEQSAQHLIRILGEPDRMYKDQKSDVAPVYAVCGLHQDISKRFSFQNSSRKSNQ